MSKDRELANCEYEIPYVEPDENLEDFLIEVDCWALFQDYHKHKNSQSISMAIRSRPELFRSATFRNFLADVIDGTYRPMKSGFVKNSTVEKARRVCATVRYFENMGLPIQYESNRPGKLCASVLAAERTNTSKSTVLDFLKKEEKLTFGFSAWIGHGIHTWDGVSIWVLNGYSPPETINHIASLEAHLRSLNPEDYKRLKDYAWGWKPRTFKPLKSVDELEQAIMHLERQDEYEFIKSVQFKHIAVRH